MRASYGGHRLLPAGYLDGYIFQAGKSLRGWDGFLANRLINRNFAGALMDCLAVAADGCLPAPLLYDNPPDGRHHSRQG
jgi:hypothetical protein